MSGLAGQALGLEDQSPTPIGGAAAVDAESKGSMENFIGFGLGATSYDPSPVDFDAADDTVTSAADGSTRVAPEYTDNELSWGGALPPVSPSDGILFDTVRGDSFLTDFVFTSDPSLVVTANNVSFDSATAKDLDFYYAIGGQEVGTCFDSFTLTFDVTINAGWATISQQAFESGFKSQVTGLYGVMTESHPGAAGNAYAMRWMNATPFGAGVASSAVGAGITATITVSLKAGVFTVLGVYGGVVVIDLTSPMTLGNPVDAYELPRMFSALGMNFILANMDVTSIKIAVDYPNAKYAFVGDSLTQGRFASSYDEGYGPIVRQTYPDDTILCGAPGARIADWTVPNVACVKKMSPKYIVLFLGTNDLPFVDAEVAKAEYDILANEFISSGFLVIAIGIPPANNYKTPIFNSLLQATYPRYVNCYTPLLGTGNAMAPAYDSGDGVHPNSAGHALIATTIKSAITANGWN
jgi:lysophospholipase L1-like esterase